MKALLSVTMGALATSVACWADQSDSVMPDIVAKAETRVEVLMRHMKSTRECFPDGDAQVRFEAGRVVLEDFKLYENLEPRLSEGLVAFKLNEKWGACDKDGKVILPAAFESDFEFHEGMAGVSEHDKYGFIDKAGKWVIKPKFDADSGWDFIGEVSPIRVDGKGAVIDKKGEFVWQPGLLRSEILGGGIFIQTSDGREGFLDDSGKLIPNREPNHRYCRSRPIDSENAYQLGVLKKFGKLAPAELIFDTIKSGLVEEPCEKVVQKILSLGLDVNARNADGDTAFLMAADQMAHPCNAFKVLLKLGADVNARSQNGENALHKILDQSELDIEAVSLLIDRGISVTTPNDAGETAFADVAWTLDDEPEPGEKPDPRRIVAKLLLAAGANKWKDYNGSPVTVVPALPLAVDPIVSKLTDSKQRDEAFRTILSWQKYRSKPSAPERIFRSLRHVVVCPQKKGPPVFAVFPSNIFEQRDAPKGHIILIDADGAIIPYYCNANSIDDHSEFKDINGDNVIEEVSTISFGTKKGSAKVLHVLPVTRDQRPALNIVFKEREAKNAEWSWRLVEQKEPGVFRIELGPMDTDTGRFSPKESFHWSKEKSDYVGPEGGGDLRFMRLHAADPFESDEFDRFVGKP